MPASPPSPNLGGSDPTGGRLISNNNSLLQAIQALTKELQTVNKSYQAATPKGQKTKGAPAGTSFPQANQGHVVPLNVGSLPRAGGSSRQQTPWAWASQHQINGPGGSTAWNSNAPFGTAFPRANQGHTFPGGGGYAGAPIPQGSYSSSGGSNGGVQGGAFPSMIPTGTYASGNTGRPAAGATPTSPSYTFPQANSGFILPSTYGSGSNAPLPSGSYGAGGAPSVGATMPSPATMGQRIKGGVSNWWTGGGSGGGGTGGGTNGGSGTNGGWSTASGQLGKAQAAYKSVTGYGNAQAPAQYEMSNYVNAGTVMFGNGTSNATANNILRQQAFGSNAIAINGQDAAQAYTNMIGMAGTGNLNSTAYGRSMVSGLNAIGYANPSLTATQSSNVVSNLYSPSTSMMLQRMGDRSTPLMMGTGKANGIATTQQGLMQMMFRGKSQTSQSALAGSLVPGQPGYIDLSAAGLSGSSITALTPTLEGINRLRNRNYSGNQIQNLFNSASRGNKSAQQTLQQQGGMTISDQQAYKNYMSTQTSQQSDTMNSFSSGLQAATKGLGDFQKALTKILNATGGNSALGFLGGSGNGLSTSMASNAFSGMGMGAGIMGMLKLFGMGGGGAGGTTGAAGSILSKVGMAGGGSAGGGLLGSLGAIGGGITAGLGLRALGDSMSPKGTTAGTLNAISQKQLPGVTGFLGGILSKLATNVVGGGSTGVATTGQSSISAGAAKANTGSVPRQAITAVNAAEKEKGVPYVYGGETPGRGFDCSGLMQWAYGQAGVKLPRTSQKQWSSLSKRSVALNKVQEGDLVFQAGSDGSDSSPGHVAMLVNNHQIIEAPHTGADVRIRAYNPGEWQHAGRPSGSMTGGAGSSGSSAGSSGAASANTGSTTGPGFGVGLGGLGGNSGLGYSEGGMLSSGSESSMLGSGGAGAVGGAMGASTVNTTSAATAGTGGSTGGGTGKPATGSTLGTLSQSQVEKLWTSLGGSAGAAMNMAKIAYAESGDKPSAVQSGVSLGVTGYGLYQITPTSGIKQNGAYGNLLNASNNTRAAIALYKSSGYSPWASDAVGKSLTGYANGGPVTSPVALVGERGPEVLTNTETARILQNAANSQSSSGSSGSAPAININFGNGAIQVTGGGTGSGTAVDLGNSARQMANEFLSLLSSENIYQAIQKGQKL